MRKEKELRGRLVPILSAAAEILRKKIQRKKEKILRTLMNPSHWESMIFKFLGVLTRQPI